MEDKVVIKLSVKPFSQVGDFDVVRATGRAGIAFTITSKRLEEVAESKSVLIRLDDWVPTVGEKVVVIGEVERVDPADVVINFDLTFAKEAEISHRRVVVDRADVFPVGEE
jgi:hypothetical protein